jgi:hypothetical protein
VDAYALAVAHVLVNGIVPSADILAHGRTLVQIQTAPPLTLPGLTLSGEQAADNSLISPYTLFLHAGGQQA